MPAEESLRPSGILIVYLFIYLFFTHILLFLNYCIIKPSGGSKIRDHIDVQLGLSWNATDYLGADLVEDSSAGIITGLRIYGRSCTMQYMIYLDQPISADKILFHPNSSKSYSVQLQGSSRVQKAGCTPTIKVTGSVELWLLQVSSGKYSVLSCRPQNRISNHVSLFIDHSKTSFLMMLLIY